MRVRASRAAWMMAFPILGLARIAAATVNHPFGAHTFAYAPGTIRPSDDQATLDQAVRDFYDAWKARFVREACGPGRYVVLTAVRAGNLTVSEGHGYGMILTALMAGHDPEAQTIFDGMYTHFREHPTAMHQHLMSWNQNRGCADLGGKDSASDGDLDIAFALLLADKQWGSCGTVDYLAEASRVIADIRDGELDASGQWVLLGDWVRADDAQYYPSTRSSDFMPDHYRSYQAATGDAAWTSLLDRTWAVVDALQTDHSPATGLLPDFVLDPLGAPHPAGPGFLEGPDDGAYGYNACRDPWRLATDHLVSGDARARTAAQLINDWIRAATGGDPHAVKSGYALDGTTRPDQDYLSMAFVAPLGVGAMVDAANQAWLDVIWDLVVATPIEAEGYYENTLKLLAMVVMSGNWWAPEVRGPASCDPGGTALCHGGALVPEARVTLKRLGDPPGDESLQVTASLVFPEGIPVSSLAGGAQLLIEDLGAGGAAILDLTAATDPVPPAGAGACDPARDGWKVSPRRTSYRNGSTALDPPACTPGSARGLSRLQYRPRSARDVDVAVRTRSSTIGAVAGPIRVTVVLDSDAAAGQAGACGVSPPLACTPRGSTLRCER